MKRKLAWIVGAIALAFLAFAVLFPIFVGEVGHMRPLDWRLLDDAEHGNVSDAVQSLTQGADPNCHDWHGWTPIGTASYQGNDALVRILLNRHADPRYGLQHALGGKHLSIVKLLVAHGLDCHSTLAGSVLGEADYEGDIEIAQFLRLHGAVAKKFP